MRGSRLFALLPLFALATACKDEGTGAFVDMMTTWQVFCTMGVCTFQPHEQGEKVDFDVSCSRDSLGLTVTIKAPAVQDANPPVPGGTLTVSRINPATNTCVVNVSDTQSVGGNAINLSDSCPGTSADGKCTLTGALDSDGWDFAGTLKCDNMTQGTVDSTPYKLTGKGMAGPVNLFVDCG